MKIGVVTEYYYPSLGGITENVHHFCVEAKKLGHEPVVITSDAGHDPIMDTANFQIIRIGKSVPVYSNGSIARITLGFNLGRKIMEMLKSEKFDVVHIHTPLIPTLAVFAQRYAKTMTVGTFHTQFNSSALLRLLRNLAKPYFDNLNGRIAVSNLCIESINRYFKGEYRIIPNGIDIEKFNGKAEKIPEFTDGKTNIFFLSRMEPRNGLEYLIKAFSLIRKKRDDCRLIIGGDGPLRKHFETLTPQFARKDVHFLGRINGVRPNYYSTADIFCFPTTKASFGITLLEAMASAKPLVAFSIPAYKNILRNGKEGILCGDPSVENLTNALEKLMDDEEARKRIGECARERAKEYSWDKITKRIINYYEEIK